MFTNQGIAGRLPANLGGTSSVNTGSGHLHLEEFAEPNRKMNQHPPESFAALVFLSAAAVVFAWAVDAALKLLK